MKNYNSPKNMMAEDLFSKELIQVLIKRRANGLPLLKQGKDLILKNWKKQRN
jgi:hypothetical protein